MSILKEVKDVISKTKTEKELILQVEKNMKDVRYIDNDLNGYLSKYYQRSWLFVSTPDLLIRMNTKLLFGGLGISSQMIDLFIRSGFLNLTMADGDHFEVENSNRNLVYNQSVGKNKALELKRIAQDINPKGTYNAIPYYLNKYSLSKTIPNCDYFINSIDFDSSAYVISHELCRKNKVKEIFPFVLGDFAVVIFVTPDSPSFIEYFGTRDPDELKEKIIQFCIQKMSMTLPEDKKLKLNTIFNDYKKYSHLHASDPQNALGVHNLAGLVYRIIQNDLNGVKQNEFLEINFV